MTGKSLQSPKAAQWLSVDMNKLSCIIQSRSGSQQDMDGTASSHWGTTRQTVTMLHVVSKVCAHLSVHWRPQQFTNRKPERWATHIQE